MNNKITIATILIFLNFSCLSAMEEKTKKDTQRTTNNTQPHWSFDPDYQIDPRIRQFLTTEVANREKQNPNRKRKKVIL